MRPADACQQRLTEAAGSNSASGIDDSSISPERASRCNRIASSWALRFHLAIFFVMVLVGTAWAGGANNPAPTIVAVSPSSLTSGTTNNAIAVYGGGFVSGSVIDWNGTALTTTFVTAEKLTATVPDSMAFTNETASISVVSPTPGGGTSNKLYLPVGQPQSSLNWGPGLSTTVGNASISVAAGDFNADGIVDLAVANADDNTVSILLGNGDGTYTTKTTLSTGETPLKLALADFNNDGIADLVTVNTDDNTLSVFLGVGDGTFTSKSTLTSGSEPLAVSIGDFNRDGDLDIVSIQNDGSFSMFLGNGDGTFTAGTSPASVGGAESISTGDFNEDGVLDLAVGDQNGIDILLGVGDGTFGSPATISSSSADPRDIVVSDFNGDGHLDLAETTGSSIYVMLGDGTGVFTTQTPIALASGNNAFTLTHGDFNGDGKDDLVIATEDFSAAYPFDYLFYAGGGDGTFSGGLNLPNGSVIPAYQMAAADVNGDGELDLVAPGAYNAITTYLQVLPVAFAPANLSFPTVNVGSNDSIQLNLTNNIGYTLPIASVSITGADANDFTLSNNTCGSSVASGAGCSVTVTFNPIAGGLRTAYVTFVDGACDPQTQNVPVLGTGVVVAPTVTLLPTALTFNSQATGTFSDPQLATLTVTNSVGLNITGISFGGANPSDFTETDNCSTGISGNSNCTINGKFQPSAAGARAATLTVADNAADSPQTVVLTGTGSQGAPTITWPNPADIAYGTALGSTQLDASAGVVGGAFAYTPAAGTVLSVGTHTLSVTFTPTDTTDYSSATATASVNVVKAGSTTTLAQPALSYFGDSVTLSATVAPSTTGSPTGTVTFLDGSTTLGTGTISSGTATFQTSSLSVGDHNLTASYAGDTNYNLSVSSAVDGKVDANYSISAPTGSIILRPNVPVQVVITVPPVGGSFTSAVAMSISGLPSNVTASFSPTSVTPGANGATTTLTLTLSNTAGAVPSIPNGGGKFPILPTLIAGLLCMMFASSWKARGGKLARAFVIVTCLAVLIAPALFIAGCGTAVAPQSANVVVTGTSGSVQHSTNLPITIE
jgi:Bacterial Ig-like domain (group 3)/FG-GAP-like repeat/Abnormal spindle-like microcephaly-assoc'd, ASPM-SPD-2-Hydin